MIMAQYQTDMDLLLGSMRKDRIVKVLTWALLPVWILPLLAMKIMYEAVNIMFPQFREMEEEIKQAQRKYQR